MIWIVVYLCWVALMLYVAYKASEIRDNHWFLMLMMVGSVGSVALIALADWTL